MIIGNKIFANENNIFSCNEFSLVLDDNTTFLLVDTSITLLPKHIYGLVGENGCGKTTLMRAMQRKMENEPVEKFFKVPVVYVGQTASEATQHLEISILDHCLNGDPDIRRLNEALKAWESGEMEVGDGEGMARVLDELDQAKDKSAAAANILRQLGFPTASHGSSVSKLSGGFRTRLEIARGLFSGAGLLMLDEPTNHLDLEATLNLVNLLKQSVEDRLQSILVVSHDSAFLDMVCTDILSLRGQRLMCSTGNYAAFEEKARQYKAYHEKLWDSRKREEDRLLGNLEENKMKALHDHNDKAVKQAASRQVKAVERIGFYREDGKRYKTRSLKTMDIESVRLPSKAEEVKSHAELTFKIPPYVSSSSISNNADLPLLSMDRVNISLAQSNRLILEQVSVNVFPGARIGLIGKNGSGKSTLMKALMKDPSVKLSSIESYSTRGNIALVDQNQLSILDGLDEHCSAFEFLKTRHDELFPDESSLRRHLAYFGLGAGKLPFTPIHLLSGGLRVRLILADMFTKPIDVLLLDEPTNHLDFESIQALATCLESFEGAVIVVSHNCGFLLQVCKDLWKVQNKRLTASCSSDEVEFYDLFLKNSKEILNVKYHDSIEEMFKLRATRNDVIIQQNHSTSSLLYG